MFDLPDATVGPAEIPAGAVVVDVREEYERRAGHVPGSLHLPLDRLPEAAAHLPAAPLVLVCLGGTRAAFAARALRSAGLDARVLAGGMRGWVAAGLPLQPAGGTLAPHGRAPAG